jgi:ATP-dependent DNA helicase RecG
MLHFPNEPDDEDTARQRLALDEFIALQLHMRQRRRNFETRSQALPCKGDNHFIKPFLAKLDYKLTGAQTRVLRQIRNDMGASHPMRRLLQGDVGSGKTVVAACCALMALESGYNVALMAPTEILAEQHFRTFSRWLEPLGLVVQLRTGSRKIESPDSAQVPLSATEETSKASTLNPQPSTLTIGTHALVQSGFAPSKLGLVIIDEQHKFGVAQREELVRKGNYPHLLVMTATPIPRTLGLTLYGDLDVSVLDEMPPGRGRIKTYVRTEETLPKVWEFIRARPKDGRPTLFTRG